MKRSKKNFIHHNRFIAILYEYMMNTQTNSLKSKIKLLFTKIRLSKFKREIKNSSPDFDLLWEFSDFVKSSECIFNYDNNLKGGIVGVYSSPNYENGQNGFKLTSFDSTVVVKLFEKNRKVVIDINRLVGNKKETVISFINQEWETVQSTEILMITENTIRLINSRILLMLEYCVEHL